MKAKSMSRVKGKVGKRNEGEGSKNQMKEKRNLIKWFLEIILW